MEIYIYPEHIWEKFPKICYFFGNPNPEIWIKSCHVYDALKLASLPGSGYLTFVVTKEGSDRVLSETKKLSDFNFCGSKVRF